MPTSEYYEGTSRGDLAWRIAEKVKEVERTLSAGHLETKEIRNCVESVLRERVQLEIEKGRYRLVTDWVPIPLDEPSDLGQVA